jgi:hypothetical protein
MAHGQSTQGAWHIYASRTRFIPDGLLGLLGQDKLATCSGRRSAAGSDPWNQGQYPYAPDVAVNDRRVTQAGEYES